MRHLEKEKVKQLIEDVHIGKMQLQLNSAAPDEDPSNWKIQYFAGKFLIEVFNDCGRFDYISFVSYGGSLCDDHEFLKQFKPTPEQLKQYWHWKC